MGAAGASLFSVGVIAVAGPAAPAAPNFGPNVFIFIPSMPQSQIQATVNSIASQQVGNQFGTRLPGTPTGGREKSRANELVIAGRVRQQVIASVPISCHQLTGRAHGLFRLVMGSVTGAGRSP